MNNTNQEKRVPEKLERIRNEWRDLDLTNMLVTLTDKINEILSYLSMKEDGRENCNCPHKNIGLHAVNHIPPKPKEEDWREELKKEFNTWYKNTYEINPDILRDWFLSRFSVSISKSKEEERNRVRRKIEKMKREFVATTETGHGYFIYDEVLSALDKEI